MSERNLRKTEVGIVKATRWTRQLLLQSRTELSIRFTTKL